MVLAYNNRGDAWHHKGDLARAIADFSEAIRIDPGYALAYGNRGYVYYKQRDLRPRDRGLQRADPHRAGRARLSSIAATPIATPNSSTARRPTTRPRSGLRRTTRAAGAIAA